MIISINLLIKFVSSTGDPASAGGDPHHCRKELWQTVRWWWRLWRLWRWHVLLWRWIVQGRLLNGQSLPISSLKNQNISGSSPSSSSSSFSSLLSLLQSIIVAKYYLFLSFPRLYLLSITWINKLKCFASQAQIRLNLFFFIVYWFINALQRRSSYRMVWPYTVASSQCWPWGFAKCKHSVVKRCRPLR